MQELSVHGDECAVGTRPGGPGVPVPGPLVTRELPMFALGSVLLPHMVLPLHVFEPRYRALVSDVLQGDREFGVALINRGHEVGGNDERVDCATVARIVEAEELDDGRWVVIAVGTRRIEVNQWLEDDPYPRALVSDWDDPPAGPDAPELRDAVARRLRRVLGLQAELGEPTVPATTELEDDPLVASYQAAVLAPLGPFDSLRLLTADTPEQRLRDLDELLGDLAATLELRLGNP